MLWKKWKKEQLNKPSYFLRRNHTPGVHMKDFTKFFEARSDQLAQQAHHHTNPAAIWNAPNNSFPSFTMMTW